MAMWYVVVNQFGIRKLTHAWFELLLLDALGIYSATRE